MREPLYSFALLALPLAAVVWLLLALWAAARAGRQIRQRLDDLDDRYLLNVEGAERERRLAQVNSRRRREGRPPR